METIKEIVNGFFDEEVENDDVEGLKISVNQKNDTKLIPIHALIPHPNNRPVDHNVVRSLSDSIAINGLQQYPTVTDNGDGRFTILAGHHRIEACKLLLKTYGDHTFNNIRCKVIPYDRLYNELVLLDTNIQSNPLSNYEMMIAIGRKEEILKTLKQENTNVYTGSLRKVLASETRLAPTQVQTYLSIYHKATSNVKKALKDEKITLSEALRLVNKYTENQDEYLRNLHKKSKKEKAFNIKRLEDELCRKYATKVSINNNKLTLYFKGDDDFNRILELMGSLEESLC